MHISGDGYFTKQCHQIIQESLGVPKVLLTTSCTSALEMTALLLNIQPEDEVIVPAFTFVSSVNAFVLRGARPVFVDIRPDTLNLDEKLLEQAITPKTRAIVVVHYAGIGCNMGVITEIAGRYGISVIEDNAHSLYGKYKDRYLGTFGDMSTLSFHETKNFTCGEGGALIINNEQYFERAEIIREKGTDRSRFFRGQVDKYTWVDIGSSFLPSDILAAFLYAQLEAKQQIQTKRQKIWEYYHEHLNDWCLANNVRKPVVPIDCEPAYHIFYLLLPSLEQRQRLITALREQGILSVFHYLPLHLSTMGLQFGGKTGDCPVTEEMADRLLRLPLYNSLSEADLVSIVEAIQEADIFG
jgi:dTDP-4-amino-4,6-dideoxygalactose transaminase